MLSRKLDSCFRSRLIASSPILVVGMHRSGTGLLSRILERCGVFMGRKQTGNRESVFFQGLNKDGLDMLGCNWRCLEFLPSHDEMQNHYEWLKDFMLKQLENGLVNRHFGWHILKVLYQKPFHWGWKDPRNSLLLPVWKKIFPQAKIIHISRNGGDVALSLLSREIKREKNPRFFDLKKKKELYVSNLNLQ